MSAESRKRRIAARFGAAASTYECNALLQKRVAETLAQRIRARGVPQDARVLEIGCGTGFLTRLIPAAFHLATDIAPGQIAQARASAPGGLAWAAMDGERPAIREGSVDLVISSLATQWFHDQPGATAELAALLAPGGLLAIATLGPASLAEWKEAHRAEGLACGTPDYPGPKAYPGFACESERIVMDHPDALDFLRSLKQIGAAEPRPGHRPLSPGALRRVVGRLGMRPGITYEILYLFRRAA